MWLVVVFTPSLPGAGPSQLVIWVCFGVRGSCFQPSTAHATHRSQVALANFHDCRSGSNDCFGGPICRFVNDFSMWLRYGHLHPSRICDTQCFIVAAIDVLSAPEWTLQRLEVPQYILWSQWAGHHDCYRDGALAAHVALSFCSSEDWESREGVTY